jgi:hypothetical protein
MEGSGIASIRRRIAARNFVEKGSEHRELERRTHRQRFGWIEGRSIRAALIDNHVGDRTGHSL